MNDSPSTTPTTAPSTSIAHSIDVAAPIYRAFAVFHEQWDRIKPHSHNPAASPIVESVFEPRVGGTVYDRLEDGTEVHWSRVLAFEPPRRFVISWDLGPTWTIETDPARTSEVEVTFTAIDDAHTRVDLVHSHLDRHGEGWEAVRAGVDKQGGWPTYLEAFAEAVAAIKATDE